MRLWRRWMECVNELRPACGRGRTFFWMVLVLAGLSTRPERAGVTSIVRVLDFRPEAYWRLLYLFRSTAMNLDRLTELWVRMALRLFKPVMAGTYRVCLVDGIKTGKEGKKMPAVKKLYQSSGSNTKAPYIMGHSFEAVSLLVRGITGDVAAVPLVSRIHEGLIWSNRDKRSLLDKMVTLFLSLTDSWSDPVLLIADAYYASRKVILPLLKAGHHLITRARSNTAVHFPAPPPKTRRRGRPRLYGKKVTLKQLAAELSEFTKAPSPCYSDHGVELSYRCINLLWRPVGQLVRFVIVCHPKRGTIFLLSTNLELDPLKIIQLYSYRFKIEVGFKQAIHTLGVYSYHFWMRLMTPIRTNSGNQHLHMETEHYRQMVCQKMKAFHLHVQLGCIAQGLLQHLSLNFGKQVWKQFQGWLRTMDTSRRASELVTGQVLRDRLPEFLDVFAQEQNQKKLMRKLRRSLRRRNLRRVA